MVVMVRRGGGLGVRLRGRRWRGRIRLRVGRTSRLQVVRVGSRRRERRSLDLAEGCWERQSGHPAPTRYQDLPSPQNPLNPATTPQPPPPPLNLLPLPLPHRSQDKIPQNPRLHRHPQLATRIPLPATTTARNRTDLGRDLKCGSGRGMGWRG